MTQQIQQIQSTNTPKAPERIYKRSEYNKILASNPIDFTAKVKSGAWQFLEDDDFYKIHDKDLPPGHHTMSDGRVFTID
ncbi:MAG: hypothetical protein HC769_31490 [Cyanobacteria bacterium CRU_2_1]|nr:hypothetical protein [Cyanobacteria bacterium CRU_2_1]